MKRIKPHAALKYVRADEIAECWDGVSEALYSALWNKVVPQQNKLSNIEDCGPADVIGIENVAKHWKLLSDDEKNELNALAAKQEI